MPEITIADLEVFFHVGVTAPERARPQRLLLTAEMEFDFSTAARGDQLAKTIDYFAVTQRILQYGEGRQWKLIETLAVSLAEMIKAEFQPRVVTVEVKKFIIPQARFVSVTWTQKSPSRARSSRPRSK